MRLARGWWRNGRIVVLTVVATLLLSATLPAQNLESENRRLREELEKSRREVQSLREENARLKSAPVPAPAVSTPASGTTVAAPASTPVAAVAPVAPGSVVVPAPIADGSTVSIEQLLADYRASGLAGDARYKGRRIRLEGDVHSFKKQFVGLGWNVEMRGGDKLGLVRCSVSFPGVSDFRPSPDNARILEGRHPFKAWLPLLQMGEKVVLEGVCTGIDGAVVAMKDCHPVS